MHLFALIHVIHVINYTDFLQPVFLLAVSMFDNTLEIG